MKITPFAITALLAACGSKGDPKKSEPDVAADPACTKKTSELEPFLATLFVEQASVEIDLGWKPQVIDRPAAPIEDHLDNATITATSQHVFDASERNHADVKPGTPAERLKATFALRADEKSNHTRLRVDVDTDAKWGDVAGVAEAAAAAGYTDLVFAFETQSKLTPPPGTPAKTTDRGAVDKASAELTAMKRTCKPLGGAGLDTIRDTGVESAKERAKRTAAALATCNCAVSPEALAAAMWQTLRWHQAHTRASVGVKLAVDGAAIAQPADTAWSTAHAKLLAATGVVKLVATK